MPELKDQGREADVEGGFTLIEIMVSLTVIAILLAVAIPVFLGVTGTAGDRATQSDLTNGLTAAALQYQAGGQSYLGVSAKLTSSEPEFTWTGASSTCSSSQPNCISVDPVDVAKSNDNQGVVISIMSKTGTCWWLAQLQTAPAVVASSGFLSNATVGQPGNESTGNRPATITAPGTYYAKMTGPGAAAACTAGYPMTASAGFNWGTSFAAAGNAG